MQELNCFKRSGQIQDRLTIFEGNRSNQKIDNKARHAFTNDRVYSIDDKFGTFEVHGCTFTVGKFGSLSIQTMGYYFKKCIGFPVTLAEFQHVNSKTIYMIVVECSRPASNVWATLFGPFSSYDIISNQRVNVDGCDLCFCRSEPHYVQACRPWTFPDSDRVFEPYIQEKDLKKRINGFSVTKNFMFWRKTIHFTLSLHYRYLGENEDSKCAEDSDTIIGENSQSKKDISAMDRQELLEYHRETMETLTQINKRLSSPADCSVCLNAQRIVVLKPCNHFCVCSGCAAKLEKCPICRVAVVEKTRVYS